MKFSIEILIKLNLSAPDKVSSILEEDIWQAVLAANQQIDVSLVTII